MKVLISNPCLHPYSVYPPYLWARFKTYIECDYDKDLDVEWLEPIYEHFPKLTDENFDILVISWYVWNYEKQIELAREAKKKNPKLFVFAGGPQVPYNDKKVWEDYDSVDAICYTEGEKVFADFLYAWQTGNSLDINGIILRNNKDKPKVNVPKLALDNLASPYIYCKDDMERFCKEIKDKGHRLNLIWETNRGCPYSCTFCDWGMATNSKVKRFNEELLFEEIKVFMTWKPDLVFIADANWGMYNDDIEFIKALVKERYKNDYISTVVFSAAKNKKTIVNKSLELLHKAGMNGGANQLGFQHLDPEVLKIIKRDNIKTTKSLEELTETYNSGIDVIGVLILGNPGDTVDKWKHSLFQLLYMQFHDDIKVHDFMLLPNAPAAQPEYIEEYKIGWVEKYYNEKPGGEKNNRTLYKTRFITESFSFTRDDWVEMQIWSYFLQACHTLGLFRFLSMFGYHARNIRYEDFYEAVFSIPVVQEILDEVRVVLREYVFGDRQDKFINYGNSPISNDNFIYMKMVENLEEIYGILETKIEFGEFTDDIFKFQKGVSYNYLHKTDFVLQYDFKEWFNKTLKLEPFKKINSLPERTSTEYKFEKLPKLSKMEIVKALDRAPNYRHRIALHGELL